MYFAHAFAAAEKNHLLRCAIHFILAAILSGSRIFGGYAPFGLAFVAAAGAGMEGLSALLGLLVGSLWFMRFTEAMKYLATAILIFSVSLAFFDTAAYQKRPFLPLSTAACTAAVGFVYWAQAGLGAETGACFLLEILLAALCAAGYRMALHAGEGPYDRPQLAGLFLLGITLLIAIAAIPLLGKFSLGRVCAVLLVLLTGRLGGMGAGCAAGICAGLAMDTAAGTLYFSLAYSLSALTAAARRCGRALYTLLYLCGTLFSLFWATGDWGIYATLESAIAGILFLLLPEKWFRRARKRTAPKPAAPSKTLEQQLRSTARTFRSLYDSLTRAAAPAPNDENIASVFDRAADQVCRACPLCSACWERDYVTTYNALNDATPALTSRGHLLPSDLPTHFSGRCARLEEFLSAVNTEFAALLLRKQYTRQLDATRQTAREQYARLSEVLEASADQICQREEQAAAAFALPALNCDIATALRPKAGERVSGDTLSSLRTPDGTVYLLLSDGMGCGEDARRESAMTVRLLEQFLAAGIEAATALKTLNTALTLHSDESGSFTTIDLLALTQRNGAVSFYKYGAAPSYVRHSSSVRRVSGAVLPAGLSAADQAPEATTLCLTAGDVALLVSDGFVDSENDGWLQEALLRWPGGSAQALAASLMELSAQHNGCSDDASLLVLQIPPLSCPEKAV